MEIEAIANDRMPTVLGPYSQVVRAGDFLFVSGQPGIDPATGTAPDAFEDECRQAFRNLRAVLEAADSGLDRVVKTTIFLSDASLFPAMNDAFGAAFPTRPPVRSTPIVALPRALRISVEAIAAT